MKKNNLKLYAIVLGLLVAIIAVFVIVSLATGRSIAEMFADLTEANGILIGVCVAAILGAFLWLMFSPDKVSGKWQPQQLVIGALCLALDQSGRVPYYRGVTIFTLDMAYNNARLIAKPDVFWLNDLV